MDEIEINGIFLCKKSLVKNEVKNTDGLVYTLVRTAYAGVHAGFLASRNGDEVVLYKSRRIWYWCGAASLSQLAVDGTSKPTECKFPCEVAEILVLGAIECIPVTQKAYNSIINVPVWEE